MWLEITGYVVGGLLVTGGLVGTLFPVIPGTPVIFLGALVVGFANHFEGVGAGTLVALGIIAAVSWLLAQFAGAVGAKKFGSSRWGVVGATVGGLSAIFVGAFLGPLAPFAFVILPFFGAALAELLHGRSLRVSLKSAFGSFLGNLGGIAMQFVFGIVMVVVLVRALL